MTDFLYYQSNNRTIVKSLIYSTKLLNSFNKKQASQGNAKTERKIPEYKVSKSLK